MLVRGLFRKQFMIFWIETHLYQLILSHAEFNTYGIGMQMIFEVNNFYFYTAISDFVLIRVNIF